MSVATPTIGGRWSGVRRGLALLLSPALAVLALLVVPAVPAAAVGCSFSDHTGTNVTVSTPSGPATLFGQEFAGHYSGNTVVPSKTQVTSAGEEAQCLLNRAGYNTQGIDGVFGMHSQAAAHAFQSDMNAAFGAGLSTDGQVGPKTWPWLRWWSQ